MGLYYYACFVAASAFFLLFAGGMVTSTGAGLSVPDWPLSFGKVMPDMVGGVYFEHGHRMVASAVGLLTFALSFWVWRADARPWMRQLAAAAATLIVVQGLLGGLTVLLKIPAKVSIAHACLGQAVFCVLVALAQGAAPWFKQTPPPQPSPQGGGRLWKLGAVVWSAVYLQLFFGARLRHTGEGVALHILWAFVVLGLALTAAGLHFARREREATLAWPSAVLAAAAVAQVGLGFVALMVRRSPTLSLDFHQAALLITSHLALGAFVLGTALVWTMRAYRVRAC